MIFTDHGDGTREPEPPTYRSRVLCLDAVEISTVHGHLLAFGIPQAPYPLGGEARDVLDDVHRLGGVGFAAHPDSPKPDLQWRGWSDTLDGVEIVNLDTGWRAAASAPGWRPKMRLLKALATYPVRPSPTIATLIAGHADLLGQWDTLAAVRRVPMLAGVDAHARLALRETHDRDNRFALSLPGYEAVFRTLTMRVQTETPLTGDADTDAASVLAAIGRGRAYASVDAILGPAAFEFTASGGGVVLQMGDEGDIDGPVTLTVRTNAPASFTTMVRRNGVVIASQPSAKEFTLTADAGAAVYRAEIRATDRPGSPLWVLGNPIYVRTPRAAEAPASASTNARPRAGSGSALVLFGSRTSAEWHTEVSAASKAAINIVNTPTSREMLVRYGLPGSDAKGEFAAAVADTTGAMRGRTWIRFTIRSAQPMRVSVQVRVPASDTGERWQRSIYVDQTERTYTLALDDFRLPLGQTSPSGVDGDAVHGVIFAVDRVNTAPGASGRFWLRDVTVE